jgi:hypothetical protein
MLVFIDELIHDPSPLSGAQTMQRRMLRRLMNNELQGIQPEAVVP